MRRSFIHGPGSDRARHSAAIAPLATAERQMRRTDRVALLGLPTGADPVPLTRAVLYVVVIWRRRHRNRVSLGSRPTQATRAIERLKVRGDRGADRPVRRARRVSGRLLATTHIRSYRRSHRHVLRWPTPPGPRQDACAMAAVAIPCDDCVRGTLPSAYRDRPEVKRWDW
jgi:hypothetical protein